MKNTSSRAPLSVRDLAYYRQRLKNHIYTEIFEMFYEQAQSGKLTQKRISALLKKDKGWVSRQFNEPNNWTLETISDLLLAMDAELEVRAKLIHGAQPQTTFAESRALIEPARHGNPTQSSHTYASSQEQMEPFIVMRDCNGAAEKKVELV